MFPFLSRIKAITPYKAKENIDKRNCVVVDIRARDAFNQGHIPGSVWIDKDNLTEFTSRADKAKMVICCCYKGVSSLKVTETLQKAGFRRAYSLKGGFEGWSQTFPEMPS